MIFRLHGFEPSYIGQRLSAEEYFKLGETPERCELIDGVVRMSPGPIPVHGAVVAEVASQLGAYLKGVSIGRTFVEVDLFLGKSRRGGDLVYRPDLLVLRSEQVVANFKRIVEPPAVVVEVVSESSRTLDLETKKGDYQRFGVSEYWIIDPIAGEFAFHRLQQAEYILVPTDERTYQSAALPGFSLDLNAIRASFLPS